MKYKNIFYAFLILSSIFILFFYITCDIQHTNLFAGDQSLFARKDGVEASWSVIDNYEKVWALKGRKIFAYKSGSMGPDTNVIFKGEGECHNWPLF